MNALVDVTPALPDGLLDDRMAIVGTPGASSGGVARVAPGVRPGAA